MQPADPLSGPRNAERLSPAANFAGSRTLLRDGFQLFGSRLLSAFVRLAMGRLMQLAAGGLLALAFLGMAEPGPGAVGAVGPVSFTLASTQELVSATVGLVVGLVMASWLTFSGRSRVAELAATYERRCTERVVSAGLRPQHDVLPDRDLLRIATRDARYAGRGLAEIGAALVPAVTAVACVALMLVLDGLLTAVLMVLALSAWPVHRRVIARGTRSMVGIETLSRVDALEKASILGELRAASQPGIDIDTAVQRALATPAYDQYLESYTERLKAPHFSVFVGAAQSAILGGIALIFLALGEVLADRTISSVVIYFLILQFALASALSLGKHANNLRIFQSQFVRVLPLLAGDAPARAELDKSVICIIPSSLTAEEQDRPDVVVVLDGSDDRANLRRVATGLVTAGVWSRIESANGAYVTTLPPASGTVLSDFYRDMRDRAGRVLADDGPALPSMERLGESETQARLDRVYVVLLGLASSGADFFAVNLKDYLRLGPARHAQLRAAFGERPLLLALPFTKSDWPPFPASVLVAATLSGQVVDVCRPRDVAERRSDWDEMFRRRAVPNAGASEALDDLGLDDQ